MAKKVRYVKLGEKALSFYDPTTKMSLAVGEALEVKLIHQQSKRFARAIKSGHLDYIDSSELANYRLMGQEEGDEEPVQEEESWKDEVVYEEKYLSRLKVGQLRELANDLEVEDLTEAEIEEATKSELILAILNMLEEEDEEDEE